MVLCFHCVSPVVRVTCQAQPAWRCAVGKPAAWFPCRCSLLPVCTASPVPGHLPSTETLDRVRLGGAVRGDHAEA